MIQTLIAFTIIIMLIMTITSSVVIIKKEQNVFKQRFKNMHRLHDILVKELNEEVSNSKINRDLNLEYMINYQDELVKVCGSWINMRQIRATRCFYGEK